MSKVARASALTQGYGSTVVLSDLHIELGAGITGLLGPNGAGKSTLLRTLATVTPPRSGCIEIFGEVVATEVVARRVRRRIGYLPQDFGYYPAFSVYDFVRYVAWLRQVDTAVIDSAVRTALERVGLANHAKSKMRSLSGGMLRRAGIASAIVGEPQLLLLDEPTVGLDPAQRLDFRQLLRSLTETAVVVSTHLVEDVAAVCDRVAVMRGGRVIFDSTPYALASTAKPNSVGDTDLERGYMTVLESAVTVA